MNHIQTSALPGEGTLLESWGALATTSPGAHLVYTRTSLAAVYPHWAPLNNAVLLDPPSEVSASEAAAELAPIYAAAAVPTWALWLPGPGTEFDSPDVVSRVDGMARDTTTLVMTLDLRGGYPSDGAVRRTTIDAAIIAGDEPVAEDDLPAPDTRTEFQAWTLVSDGFAVASALTYAHGGDVAISAVGTAPDWRRRGLARRLMLHVLADAHQRGARTASLQSTRMGESLYRSVGFHCVGRYEEWVCE
jgi:GNAT superfamily N-acetyltransferase